MTTQTDSTDSTMVGCRTCGVTIATEKEHDPYAVCGSCEKDKKRDHTIFRYDGYNRVPVGPVGEIGLSGWVYDQDDNNIGEIAIKQYPKSPASPDQTRTSFLDEADIRRWAEVFAHYVECFDKNDFPEHPQIHEDNVYEVSLGDLMGDLEGATYGCAQVIPETIAEAGWWIRWIMEEVYDPKNRITVDAELFTDSDVTVEMSLGQLGTIQLIVDESQDEDQRIHLRTFDYTAKPRSMQMRLNLWLSSDSDNKAIVKKLILSTLQHIGKHSKTDQQ